MEVVIELRAGANHRHHVTKQEMQKNIDALKRAIDGKPLASDYVLLIDTRSILEGIQAKLPSA